MKNQVNSSSSTSKINDSEGISTGDSQATSKKSQKLWLRKHRRTDQNDLTSLMGSHRLTQALDLEEKASNHHLIRGLYYLSGAVILFFPIVIK